MRIARIDDNYNSPFPICDWIFIIHSKSCIFFLFYFILSILKTWVDPKSLRRVLTCGDGTNGQLGNRNLDIVLEPCEVEALNSSGIVFCCCGLSHMAAIAGNNHRI